MKPLTGVKIIDLTQYLPGPLGAQMLADFGAEVIKIEAINGELGRIVPPQIKGNNARYYNVNRNKKSLALDLKSEEGKQILRDLVKDADVVFEQFRPETMNKLGLGYEDLRKINKKLVYCALTGYGYSGPLKMAAGHDNNYLSMTGILDISGTRDGGPGLVGTQIADIAGGTLHAVIAILLALRARDLTGEGQFCDVSMADAMASTMLAYVLADYWETGVVPGRAQGILNGGVCYYNIYKTADDRYVSLGAIEPKFWSAFCERMGHEDWLKRGVSPKPDDQKQMIDELSQEFAKKSQQDWVEFFADLDICFAPIISIDEMIKHPQIVERELVLEVDDFADSGKTAYFPGIPIKLSKTPGEAVLEYSNLGENSKEILSTLGYSDSKIDELLEKKVIGVSDKW